jgi:DNA modification methylase
MHQRLDMVWNEVRRVLRPGGIACINIGDATRAVAGEFRLYPNHARVLTHLVQRGFTALPDILWRKPTNSPNKFLGSGVMPPGAYVTLEHEHILIVRKGSKRVFRSVAEKGRRRASSFFWEERNTWFSDVWTDVSGAPQELSLSQQIVRSAVYPFQIPYRLISMFSLRGDTVLDPFVGTGTTTLAALTAGRHSIGYESDTRLQETIRSAILRSLPRAQSQIEARLRSHCRFVQERTAKGGLCAHVNRVYGFPVVTEPESDLALDWPIGVREVSSHRFEVEYAGNRLPPGLQEYSAAPLPSG